MKKLFFVGVLLVLAMMPFVSAAQPSGGTIVSSGDNGAYSGGSAGSIPVTSGTIYYANISGEQNSYRWVGLYGNVSGTIVLADSSGNKFYNWTGATGVLTYASTAGSISWSSLVDANATAVTANDTWLAAGVTDDYASTFNGASESIGSHIFSISSDYTAPNPSASGFKTYSLGDGTALVWAGKVVSPAATYDGNTADFEMMLPEDGTNGNTAATTYNFWVELQ